MHTSPIPWGGDNRNGGVCQASWFRIAQPCDQHGRKCPSLPQKEGAVPTHAIAWQIIWVRINPPEGAAWSASAYLKTTPDQYPPT